MKRVLEQLSVTARNRSNYLNLHEDIWRGLMDKKAIIDLSATNRVLPLSWTPDLGPLAKV